MVTKSVFGYASADEHLLFAAYISHRKEPVSKSLALGTDADGGSVPPCGQRSKFRKSRSVKHPWFLKVEKLILAKVHVIREQNTEELDVMVVPVDYSLEIANVERMLQNWSLAGKCDAGYDEDGTMQ